MKNLTSPLHQPQNRRAVVSVEFALLAPIIFMIFTGCLELTNLNLIRNTAGNAAYEAARASIVPGSVESDSRAIGMKILKAAGAEEKSKINFTNNGRTITAEVIVPVKDNSWGLAHYAGVVNIKKKCTLTREL